MKKEFLIQKSSIQANGLVSNKKLPVIELMEGMDAVERFNPVILTEGGYASKKAFKIDFSNYEPIGEEGIYLIFSEEVYFDLKSKYCKEYKSYVDDNTKNIAGWNQVFINHTISNKTGRDSLEK